jgi:hypothetical protein
MASNPESVGFRIVARMKRGRPAHVWTARDFVDIGTRTAIDVALHRLEARDLIRRIHHGLYDIPQIRGDVVVLPDYASVLAAVGRRDGVKVLVDPHSAAQRLGLAEGAPAKIVVLTTGRLIEIPLGRRTICFRTVAPSRLVWAGRPAAYFVQALRYLRNDLEASNTVLWKLREILDDKGGAAIRKDLERGLGQLPVWLVPHVKRLLRLRTA